MREDLIFSLDIGTRTIIGIVGEYGEDEIFRIKGYSLREHKKRNMFDGQIHDIEGVAKVVREVVNDLEEQVGEKLTVASIAAAGRALKTHKIRIEKQLDSNREINKIDIETLEVEAIQQAQEEMNSIETNKVFKYYNVGYTVVDYYLDEERMENLEGHIGNRIGVELLATFLPQVVIESLYTVISRVGLEVGSITLEPIAAINVAIKKELRLLNLALVDIGAGTSDIAITKEGQIISYGMTSTAGDEITERLATAYLLDFNNSEKLKISLNKSDNHEFTDVVGITYNLSTEEIVYTIKDVIENIAENIAKKILEYNSKAPSAVFLVGGSSQMPTLRETIAEKLGLPKERVSIRDASVIEKVEGIEDTMGPDIVTPIGIALEGAQDKYKNFIKVKFNGEEVRIFNTDDIKVSDILVLTGYNPRDLLPKKSNDFIYYINGKKRIIKGNDGTQPEILVDNKVANLKTKLNSDSIIEIIPSEVEPMIFPYLYDLIEREKDIVVGDKTINLIESIKVNNEIIDGNIILPLEANIEIHEIKTIEDLIMEYYPRGTVNDFIVNGIKVQTGYLLKVGDLVEVVNEDINKKPEIEETKKSIVLVINKEPMEIYYTKDQFVFVDIFNHIDFDLSSVKGKLVLKINHRDAEYLEELKNGDNIEIYWE